MLTWEPPISFTNAVQWGSQENTLRSANAGAEKHSARSMKVGFRNLMVKSSMKSEGVRRMGAHGHDVLQEHLVVGRGARLVAVELQADAAEFGVGEVDHGALAVWGVAARQQGRRLVEASDAVVAGHAVVTQAETPLGHPLVSPLHVPAFGLAGIETATEAGGSHRAVEGSHGAFLAAVQVLRLEDKVTLVKVPVGRPFPHEIHAGDVARASEHRAVEVAHVRKRGVLGTQ